MRVTGTPAPRISWFKDGLEVFSGRRSRVVTDGEGTIITSSLIIHQAALADEGEIKCAATNRAGHAVTKARLRLEGKAEGGRVEIVASVEIVEAD